VSTESLEMPELYNLWLTVKEFPCRNLVFRNARLLLRRPNTETKACDYDFAGLIQNCDPNDVWTDYPRKFIAYDLFTAGEKAAIEAYLATHRFGGSPACGPRNLPHYEPLGVVKCHGIWELAGRI
jgi:hypothetical protein